MAILSSSQRFRGAAFAVGVLVFLLCGATARAQGAGGRAAAPLAGSTGGLNLGSYDTKVRPTQLRVLTGQVVDKDGVAIKGAIVYLQNGKTSSIRSVTVDDKGKYRFMDLNRTIDYKLWAAAKDKKTPEKTISSFETRDELQRDLKME